MGAEALLDTKANLEKRGIKTVGAGRNIEEARQPAFLERKGIRVAFLAYCSILKEGYAAGPDKPGVAPLHVDTFYRPIDDQPGIPAIPVTIANDRDLRAIVHDVKRAKEAADIVVVSMHWGVHYVPRLIADYQTTTAEAVFAAGADVIFGHHAHVAKAIGVHAGKVCFYSLNSLIMTSPPFTPARAAQFTRKYGAKLDPDYPNFRYGADSKNSLLAKVVASKQGVKQVSFLPLFVDKQYRPVVLKAQDERFSNVVRFMGWVSEDFAPNFTVRGDEVIIS